MSEETQPKLEKVEQPSLQTHLQQAMDEHGAASLAELQKIQAAARGGYVDRIQIPANFSETAKAEIQKLEDELQTKTRLRDEIASKLAKGEAKKQELNGQISTLADTLNAIRKQTEASSNRDYLKSCLNEREEKIRKMNALNALLEREGLQGIVDMDAVGLGASPLDAAIKHDHFVRRQKANAEAKAKAAARR